jgi:two-component system nitrogen regulation sensor histidine kinase GlnL
MFMNQLTMLSDAIECKDVLENLTTALIVLDRSLRVIYINTATEMLFEISQRQAELIPLQTLLPGEKNYLTLSTALLHLVKC